MPNITGVVMCFKDLSENVVPADLQMSFVQNHISSTLPESLKIHDG